MTRDYTDYWSTLKVSHDSHPANRFRYDLIARELAQLQLKPMQVVDCGCGDGSLLSVITRRIPCREVWGLDVAANVPIHRNSSSIHFQQQDLSQPIAENLRGQFDLVLCSEVIEHVPDDDAALRNLSYLCKPGGTVVVSTQSGTIYKTEQFLGHLRHYDADDLTHRMERTGLSIQKVYLCGWPWLNLQKISAHIFQGTVQKQIVQATELSPVIKVAFEILYRLYRFSSRKHGPQILIVAERSK